ncbi:MAG: DUF177 domain-containing protein [bacterium]
MKIDLTELLRRVGNDAEFEREVTVSFPEDGLILTKPVKVTAHLLNTGTSVLIRGKFETEAELECARCTKKFRAPLSCRINEEYSKEPPATPKGKKDYELKEEDFVYSFGPDNVLDLDEVIRQDLLLALPIKPLCEDEDNN